MEELAFMIKFKKIQACLLSSALLICSAGSLLGQQGGFYDGARQGSRGGYNDQDDRRYAERHHRGDTNYQQPRRYLEPQRQGGIGPGKGAAIGAAGGAALGAIFGGGLKGAVIGGAAGAGVGAIAGKANQDNRNRDYRDYRR